MREFAVKCFVGVDLVEETCFCLSENRVVHCIGLSSFFRFFLFNGHLGCIPHFQTHPKNRIKLVKYLPSHYAHDNHYIPISFGFIPRAKTECWSLDRWLSPKRHPSNCIWHRGPSLTCAPAIGRSLTEAYMGLSRNGGTPKLLVYQGKTHLHKWMIWGYTPISGNFHIDWPISSDSQPFTTHWHWRTLFTEPI